jgi:hypothetical protein
LTPPLDVAFGAQTTVTLELAEPVTHLTFLGRRRDVRLVRCHADDADRLVKAIKAIKVIKEVQEVQEVQAIQAVRQARTSPSSFPDGPV